MTMPNFLIIGAPKAGSTSLYRYLSEHPQIYMSPVKQPKFFAFEGEKVNYQGPKDAFKPYVTDLGTYHSLFEGVSDEIAIGEASSWYLYIPKSSERIYHHIPEAKLIAILRDPVDRAYSNFLSQVQLDYEPFNDFAKALDAEPIRIKKNWSPRWHYKQRGFYYQQLKPYFQKFNSKQIRIYLHQDLSNNRQKMLTDIFQFLGVDNTFEPDLSRKYNVTKSPRNRKLFQFFSKPNIIKAMFRPFFTPDQRTRIVSKLTQLSTRPKPSLSLEIRERLISEYREDILSLQDLIQRDLSSWLALEK